MINKKSFHLHTKFFTAITVLAIAFFMLPSTGLHISAEDAITNTDGIISPIPTLSTDWTGILDMKFYPNQIFDTARRAPSGNDPHQAGELYVLYNFQTTLQDIGGRPSMAEYEADYPGGYYKIIRPPYFNETTKEYKLVFFSADDEEVVTVAERFIIGNLFNEGVFGNGVTVDTGYFLFTNTSLYETKAADGGVSYTYDFETETAGRRFDSETDDDNLASGILLITPQGFNQALTVIYDAQVPVITRQTDSIICTQNGSSLVSVTANSTDDGDLSYQWYSNTTASNVSGSLISGANAASYSPSTTTAGTFYYYCQVTNANIYATGDKTASTVSAAVTVTVTADEVPVVPAAPDVGDPDSEEGDSIGVIVSEDVAATIDETGFQQIFAAAESYSETPILETQQNIYSPADETFIEDNAGYIVIELVVEETSTAPEEIQAQAEYSAADVVFPLDISIIKSYFNSDSQYLDGETITDAQTPALMEIQITLPVALRGKLRYKLIRKHGEEITVLTTDETNPANERIAVSGRTLTIYAKKFSDYVIVAENKPVTPPPAEVNPPASTPSYSSSYNPYYNTPVTILPQITPIPAPTLSETAYKFPLSKFIINQEVVRRADITNATGSMNANRTLANLQEVYENAIEINEDFDKITIEVSDAGLISYKTFDRIAEFAREKDIDVIIHADNMNGKKVATRLVIDAKEYERTNKSLFLKADVLTESEAANLITDAIENEFAVLRLNQTGDLKGRIEVDVKLDIEDTENLSFYSFNPETNKYSAIFTWRKIDKNGYIHFSTDTGGYILVTDGYLKVEGDIEVAAEPIID
ncbi:MAG: hypothetical protein LBM41_08180 [Ruminococcus sp.]|jgi:hypothetical protein|nr:hypothetical protein [Ruminococcus sp.]